MLQMLTTEEAGAEGGNLHDSRLCSTTGKDRALAMDSNMKHLSACAGRVILICVP